MRLRRIHPAATAATRKTRPASGRNQGNPSEAGRCLAAPSRQSPPGRSPPSGSEPKSPLLFETKWRGVKGVRPEAKKHGVLGEAHPLNPSQTSWAGLPASGNGFRLPQARKPVPARPPIPAAVERCCEPGGDPDWGQRGKEGSRTGESSSHVCGGFLTRVTRQNRCAFPKGQACPLTVNRSVGEPVFRVSDEGGFRRAPHCEAKNSASR